MLTWPLFRIRKKGKESDLSALIRLAAAGGLNCPILLQPDNILYNWHSWITLLPVLLLLSCLFFTVLPVTFLLSNQNWQTEEGVSGLLVSWLPFCFLYSRNPWILPLLPLYFQPVTETAYLCTATLTVQRSFRSFVWLKNHHAIYQLLYARSFVSWDLQPPMVWAVLHKQIWMSWKSFCSNYCSSWKIHHMQWPLRSWPKTGQVIVKTVQQLKKYHLVLW